MRFISRRHTLLAALAAYLPASVRPAAREGIASELAARKRARPGDPGWPAPAAWRALQQQVGEAYLEVRSPLGDCAAAGGAGCAALFEQLKNPYHLGDQAGLTQTLGWTGAWTSQPSVVAVAARHAADVAAAVRFARQHDLRLVVKGGGHSYQGTSSAPDSLLVWTRRMRDIQLHEAFVAQGCEAHMAPTRAVSVGAGCLWGEVYDAVTTRGGGYVQGGGCLSVGVAGLVQSGGFGSFSKAFGLAASHLLEAEVVIADGTVLTVNAQTHPDLFWALKGGGGGSFGVVTRLTLRVHPLPETFGAVNFSVRATSPAAYRRLVQLMVDFCATQLVNPHWGEQIRLRRDEVQVAMVFQGLSRSQALAVWQPLFDALDQAPADFVMGFAPLKVVATTARNFFAPTWFKRLLGFIRRDDRPGAPATNVFWPGDQAQAGQVLHGYGSAWLPATLLAPARRAELVDALVAAAAQWSLSLHLNKGLAGAPAEMIEAARDTAVNPAALDAFALAISGAEEGPAYPGIAGHEPDQAAAARHRTAVTACMAALRPLLPAPASYLAESDYFEPDWATAHWGPHHTRLAQVKALVDPDDLFVVHHGVGSQRWSEDGFSQVAG